MNQSEHSEAGFFSPATVHFNQQDWQVYSVYKGKDGNMLIRLKRTEYFDKNFNRVSADQNNPDNVDRHSSEEQFITVVPEQLGWTDEHAEQIYKDEGK